MREATLADIAAPLHRPLTNCGSNASPPLAHNFRIADGNCRCDEEDAIALIIILHKALLDGSRAVIFGINSIEEHIACLPL
jgi:hypothetical protein